ncbi:MAG: diguanylate cyclase [Clostridia bacterium]|nr:diguanylate cyclase [Clostridia bacterium]
MKTHAIKSVFVLLCFLLPLFINPAVCFASLDNRVISVVMDDNYPPYVFRGSDGKLQGILIDEWALWEQKTGLRAHVTATDWKVALSKMECGEFDVIDTVFKNESRLQFLDFTLPYADVDVSIFFHNTISGINSVDSLAGFVVGVKSGDASIDYLREQGIQNLVEYESYEKLVLAAKEGEIVTFVADEFPILYFLNKHNIIDEFNFTNPLYTGQFHRAVIKGDAQLLQLVESGFAQISEEEHEAIQEEWFGRTNESTKAILRQLAFLGAAVAGISIFLLAWNISLKKTVKQKTAEIMQAINIAEQSNKNLNAIIQAVPDLVFIVNREGVILDYLSSGSSEDRYRPKEVFLNKHIDDIYPKEIAEKFKAKVDECQLKKQMQEFEYLLKIKGHKRHYEVRLISVEEDRFLCIIRDKTEEKESQEKIYEMSIYDSVTGLYNRTFFEGEIKKLEEQNQNGIGIIMCDIDGLKLVNDMMGHQAGDRYLCSVGEILSSRIKDRGFVARIGGDEFVIVILDSSTEEMIDYVNSIMADVQEANKKAETETPISISIGYSLVGVDKEDLEGALIEADDYMYRDKLHHRQSVRSYSIDLLSKMLAERDYITEGHGDRMQKNMKAMASALNFSQDSTNDLLLFAQFHDIGKIGVPDAILYKAAPLSESEWFEMKRHSEIGFRIAESSPDLRHISEWILKHHEWWDGKGYPYGLRGLNIPLECRILSVIDAFDAMTNDRPYQAAKSQEEALEELRRFSGRQFDPELVELFTNRIAGGL